MASLAELAVILRYSLVPWLVPFLVATALHGFEDLPKGTFKSIMMVIFSWTAALALRDVLARIPHVNSILVSFIFCVVNWLLDVTVLLPLSGMHVDAYFFEIGLRYASLLAFGVVAEQMRAHKIFDRFFLIGWVPWLVYKIVHVALYHELAVEYFAAQSVSLVAYQLATAWAILNLAAFPSKLYYMSGFVFEMALIFEVLEYAFGRLVRLPYEMGFLSFLVDEAFQLSIALALGWFAGSLDSEIKRD